MASLVLRNFGGMAPSANPTTIPESQATLVRDMNLRFADFRPFSAAALTATKTAGKTLYRFDTNGAFITNAAEVNYVRGTIPNEATERTYYTGDGVPKVIDINGEVRQLGVPQPAAAPAIVVNRVAQYGPQEAEMARQQKQAEYVRVIQASLLRPYIGVSDATIGSLPTPNFWPVVGGRVFEFHAAGALVNGNFVPTNPYHRLIMDDRLKFRLDTFNGAVVGIVQIAARGATAAFDDTLNANLAAIKRTDDPTKQLMTETQITATRSTLDAGLRARDAARDATAAKIDAMMKEFVALANNGSDAADASYTNPVTVQAQVTAAVNRAVTSIFSALYDFSNTNAGLPVSVSPNPGGRNYVS